MAARREGEFEVVFGNRQLFSVLGIVVILLGIFFTMGFFAGRSVGQANAKAAEAQRKPTDNSPIMVPAPSTGPAATEPSAPVPVTEEPKPTEQTAQNNAPAPAPEKEPEKPAEKKADTKASKKEAKAETKTKAEPAPKQKPAEPAPARGGDLEVAAPPAGSYLQVAATRKADADSLARLLRQRGLKPHLAPSTNAELIRVLVGPFESASASAEAKSKLKDLGIDKPIPKKY